MFDQHGLFEERSVARPVPRSSGRCVTISGRFHNTYLRHITTAATTKLGRATDGLSAACFFLPFGRDPRSRAFPVCVNPHCSGSFLPSAPRSLDLLTQTVSGIKAPPPPPFPPSPAQAESAESQGIGRGLIVGPRKTGFIRHTTGPLRLLFPRAPIAKIPILHIDRSNHCQVSDLDHSAMKFQSSSTAPAPTTAPVLLVLLLVVALASRASAIADARPLDAAAVEDTPTTTGDGDAIGPEHDFGGHCASIGDWCRKGRNDCCFPYRCERGRCRE
ncbi:hypothetical protein VTO42DRAFT_2102 [Malbranchea cinnamomea]